MTADRIVSAVLEAAGAYLALGGAFAIAFHGWGIAKVDPATRGAGIGFRLLVTPGIVALWPLLAARWARVARGVMLGPPPDPSPSARRLRSGHRALARLVAVVAAVAVSAAVALREPRPGVAVRSPEVPDSRLVEALRFDDLPIRASVVAVASRRRAVRIAVARDLDLPPLALILKPAGAAESRVLGSVWGPADLRFTLPEIADGGGLLVLVDPIGGDVVARSELAPVVR